MPTYKPSPFADPGYGDPNAPRGSAEWAKRWRLCFQGAAKRLPDGPEQCAKFYETGREYRAWTLIGDEHGKPFATFDEFCAKRQPYGLGVDPVKFRAYLAAEIGERAMELETAAPDTRDQREHDEQGRFKGTDHSPQSEGNGQSVPHAKTERLRAILRAPEAIQALYRDGLVGQAEAALMGPKQPDEAKAVKVVQARQAVEAIQRNGDDRAYRKEVNRAIREAMGAPTPTPLEKAQQAFGRLSVEDKATFRSWLAAQS